VTGAQDVVDAAVARLGRAADTGTACAPVRDLLGRDDIGLAYRVQTALNDRRVAKGARFVGRKIGLTSLAVQQQLGVDQPDFGVLFADMHCHDGDVVPMSRLLQPKAEAEIAFVLDADLDAETIDLGQVRAAVGYAVIVDSRGSRLGHHDHRHGGRQRLERDVRVGIRARRARRV
jgi:2-keto-4-pentenoate hydratase